MAKNVNTSQDNIELRNLSTINSKTLVAPQVNTQTQTLSFAEFFKQCYNYNTVYWEPGHHRTLQFLLKENISHHRPHRFQANAGGRARKFLSEVRTRPRIVFLFHPYGLA